MSDLDAVLERLLNDPSFAAALAADPGRALAGYRLDADEMELLSAQLSMDAGGERRVEARTSQASMFGLLAPLAGMAGFGAPEAGQREVGAATARAGFGAADAVRADFGPADVARSGFGPAEARSGFGTAETAGFGAAEAAGFGAPDDAEGTVVATGFGAAEPSDVPVEIGPDRRNPADQAPPAGYRTRVDVDGDGDWDRHWYAGRADGGVDILADMDGDGRADFIGHDYDRDGLVEAAHYDRDRDGRFGTHLFDDDGDGWLDRKIVSPGDS